MLGERAEEVRFLVSAGDALYVPTGVFLALRNTGWETLRLLVVYVPGGTEQVLAERPDFRQLAPGALPAWVRG